MIGTAVAAKIGSDYMEARRGKTSRDACPARAMVSGTVDTDY